MVRIPELVERFQNEDKGTLCARPDLAAAAALEKEEREQAVATEKEEREQAIATEQEERGQAAATEKEEREQAIATEKEEREQAAATEKEEREQAIATEKEERGQAITEAVTEAVGGPGVNIAALAEAAQGTAGTALANAASAAQDAANAQHAADLAMDAAEDIQALPTSLQTTDPPSFAVARAAVADGGEGYAARDALVLSDPPVAVTVSAVDGTGAITAVSFNAGTVYTDDPKGVNIAAGGGSGTGAVFEIRTAYAPGDAQADGELRHVHRSDPLVQASRMRGYIRDSISGSGLAQQVARLEAMRKWSPAYLYAEGDAAYYNGRWYAVTGAASIGEPPGGNPEKWAPVEGGVTGDALAVLESARRIELMWNEMFGNGIVFAYHFDLDFYTLDGAVLEEGVWRADLGRVEV